MASFWISSYDDTSVTVAVSPDTSNPYYRIYIKEYSSGAVVVDDYWVNLTQIDYRKYTGLAVGTKYVVNVAASPNGTAANSAWLGAQEFTTSGGVITYYGSVVLDANGGDLGNIDPRRDYEVQALSTAAFTFPSELPTRKGYTFTGWGDAATNPSNIYAANKAVIVPLSDIYPGPTTTFYAQWMKSTTGGGVRIWTGSKFVNATPYIWNGSWKKAAPYVWNGSWKKGV